MTVVVPVAIVIALIVGGGSGAPARLRSAGHRSATAAARPLAPQVQAIPPGPGALIAWVTRSTTMRAAPAGRALGVIASRTQFRSPDVLSVVTVSSGWLGVRSQFAGNGRLGWIPESVAVLERDTWSLRASLSRRMLIVLEAGRIVKRYDVGIGASRSPTPTGRFAITDRLVTHDPTGPYGCCIIALTATAPHAIPGWSGGNRIAIHATPATETIGQPDSHGCLHVTQAEAQWLVDHIPDGTPVRITA